MLIGIVGAGPAGCALACFLAQRDIECIVFDSQKRPSLLVGESLVPAAVPYLQRLGIEDEVAAVSAKKHGAALRHPSGLRVDFKFRRFSKSIPNYSYNIPRPEFDLILLRRAKSLGVHFVNALAKVEKVDSSEREIALTQASLDLAGLPQHPDFLIDATGRHRLFSRALSLKAKKGGRDDVSYFAHYDNFKSDAVVDGQVVLSVIDSGWSWQIPLKNTLSVGVVLDKQVASRYGDSPQQRLDNIIATDPLLSISGRERCRQSDVMTYSNYQLISEKAFGKGWALLGDAYGFVDPMLSPGVFMALESASLMEACIIDVKKNKTKKINYADLKKYAHTINQWHDSWATVIDYFYDGRLLGLFEAGQNVSKNASRYSPLRLMEWHIRRVIASVVSGAATRSKYNQQVLYHSCRHLLSDDIDSKRYAMKSSLKNNNVSIKEESCLN